MCFQGHLSNSMKKEWLAKGSPFIHMLFLPSWILQLYWVLIQFKHGINNPTPRYYALPLLLLHHLSISYQIHLPKAKPMALLKIPT